ncbi:MAG: hypothetical protein AAFS07_14315 [Pseudomonadota bacterium]
MEPDRWHYPRATLNTQLFTLLASGAAKAVQIYAPRRVGKSHFLKYDFVPHAARAKHPVVYIDLQASSIDPTGLLVYALEEAVHASTRATLIDRFTKIRPTVKLSVPLPSGTLGAELDLGAVKEQPPDDLLLHLGTLIGRIGSPERPVFLLIDEVQELASTDANVPLVKALRAALNRHETSVRTVFTGSSMDGLTRMFGRKTSPFFRFATTLPFPALDDGFVVHLVTEYEALYGRRIDMDRAKACFASIDRLPRLMIDALNRWPMHPDEDLIDVVKRVRREGEEQRDFNDAWIALRPIDRAVLSFIAEGGAKPFAADSRDLIGADLGEVPSAAAVQTALRKLRRRQIVDLVDGLHLLPDPEFAAWIRREMAAADPS